MERKNVIPHQSSPVIVAGAARKTPTAHIRDEAGQSQAGDAAQHDGGIGAPHHPVKHKGLNPRQRGFVLLKMGLWSAVLRLW